MDFMAEEILSQQEPWEFNNLQALTTTFPEMISELKDYNAIEVVSILSALLTRQEYHPNTLRLEALIHLAIIHCNGELKPNKANFGKWINEYLSHDKYAKFEDPVEDVFVSNVCLDNGNARIFEGIWESNDFYLQQLLDITIGLPDRSETRAYWSSIKGLLRLSEAIAERRNVKRYMLSTGSPKDDIVLPEDEVIRQEKSYISFTNAELDSYGIRKKHLEPFIYKWPNTQHLLSQEVGHTELERRPLLNQLDGLIVALPTAISPAIRRFILEWMKENHLIKTLTKNLGVTEINQVLYEALRKLKTFPYQDKAGTFQPKSGPFISTVACFDKGKYAQIIIFRDEMEEVLETGFRSFRTLSNDAMKVLSGHIKEFSTYFSEKSNYTGGLTVMIIGGIGRGAAVPVIKTPDYWHTVVLSIADIMQLAWQEGLSLIEVWKILEQESFLESNDIEVLNINNFLNLLGFWKSNGHSLCPEELAFGCGHGLVGVFNDFVTKVRHDLRNGYDEHVVPYADGVFFRVRRETPNSLFKEEEHLPIYVSYLHAKKRQLYGVIETSQRAWWLVLNNSESIPKEHTDLSYRLWDALLKWMVKASKSLEESITTIPPGPIRILISFDGIEDWPELHAETSASIKAVEGKSNSSIAYTLDGSTIEIQIQLSFLQMFHQPKNFGERGLVRAVCEAVSELSGQTIDLEGLLKTIFPDYDARFLHFFEARSFLDYIRARQEFDLIFITPEDEAITRLGLAWLVREANPEGEIIEGKESCLEFLNTLPDKIWMRLESKLSKFNFRSIALLSLENIMAIDIDEKHWSSTARAILALHNDKEDVRKTAWERNSRRSAASLASRLVVEMALCASPQEGRLEASMTDYQALMTDAILIAHIGQYSDAIRHGYMADKIGITPSGNIQIQTEFYDQVLTPRSASFFSSKLSEAAEAYDKYFEQERLEEETKTISDFFESEYTDAFFAEYGIKLDSLFNFMALCEEYAYKNEAAIIEIGPELLENDEILFEKSLNKTDVEQILRMFSLPIRPSWTELPANGEFRNKDWYPWRFRRRLALISRPIVPIRSDHFTSYLVAPSFLIKSLDYILDGSYTGAFANDYFVSRSMKEWIGQANNKRGHKFNQEIAQKLDEFGFLVASEVQISTISGRNQDKELGDIDILVWNKEKKTVYILECKDLHFAKTVGEIVEQLDRFQGVYDTNGKPDELAKHLRRVEWADKNKELLMKFLGYPGSEETQVKHFVVFSNIVPMKYIDTLTFSKEQILLSTELNAQIFS